MEKKLYIENFLFSFSQKLSNLFGKRKIKTILLSSPKTIAKLTLTLGNKQSKRNNNAIVKYYVAVFEKEHLKSTFHA